jgi:hypothetical protein
MFQDIRRIGSLSDDQLLSKSLSVDDRGLITVRARILEKRPDKFFFRREESFVRIGDNWNFGAVPNLPPAQAALRVRSVDFEKKDGYTYANATYMTAVDPPVITSSESIEKLSASFLEDLPNATIETSFDYYSQAQTLSCVLARPNTITLAPSGKILSVFNFRQTITNQSGGLIRSEVSPVTYFSVSTEAKGDIAFVSVTARTIVELAGGAPGPNPPEIDPWR